MVEVHGRSACSETETDLSVTELIIALAYGNHCILFTSIVQNEYFLIDVFFQEGLELVEERVM